MMICKFVNKSLSLTFLLLSSTLITTLVLTTSTQTKFMMSLKKEKSFNVAIIGGGISGLSCAKRLQSLGIDATVFDTGKRTVGGRCSSRRINVQGKTYPVDHSTQYITASSTSFTQEINTLLKSGDVLKWDGPIANINSPGTITPMNELQQQQQRYVGKDGMESLAAALAKGTIVICLLI